MYVVSLLGQAEAAEQLLTVGSSATLGQAPLWPQL